MTEDNRQVLRAKHSARARDHFLSREEAHIRRLASTLARKPITRSDDEWSVALLAVSQAIDDYDDTRGAFWPYAALVIKSRLADFYRSQTRHAAEIAVQPAAFDGEVDADEGNLSVQCAVRDVVSTSVDTTLRDEIEAIAQELSPYGFSFFDLARCSPKSTSTRRDCFAAIRAMLTPPPLVPELKKTRRLPLQTLIERTGLPRKLLDRHRRYVIAASLILSGEYPALSEYFQSVRKEENP